MNKNKKILLTILTLFVSMIVFINKAEAVVMWMQCTSSPEEKMDCGGDCKDYGLYNTFALIHYEGDGVRNFAYNPNNFYSGQYPVYIMAEDTSGALVGNSCWYKNYFNDIEECENEKDQMIPISKMLEGNCPTGVRKNDHYTAGFLNVVGAGWAYKKVVKDFIVIYGTAPAYESERLDNNIFVIYSFQKKGEETINYMIEGYDSSGKYGYATTWNDISSFRNNLNLKKNDSDYDLINKEEYATNHMTWDGMTQARRVANLGRNYFKLLDTEDAWLINTQKDSKFVKKEEYDDNNNLKMYRSDDSNESFYNWVSSWYEKYDEKLSGQLEIINELQNNSKYVKALKTAKEISNAVDNGKEYRFDGDYASKMVLDMEEAFDLLNLILSDDNPIYTAYDDNCQETTNKTNDPSASILTQFSCEVFGKSRLSKLENSVNANMLFSMINSSLSAAVNKYSKSDVSIDSIRSTAEEYAKYYTIAIKYIKKYNLATGDAAVVIDELTNNYNEMSKSFGTETVISCDDLFSDNLRNKIGSYLNIVKIAVPIILIGFGIIDFTKAIFAGDEDKMKKAQKDFIVRLGIAVLFFLVPTMVDLLLGLANKVWYFIEPGSCGIFDA